MNPLKHHAQVTAAWRFEWVNDGSDLDKTRIHNMFFIDNNMRNQKQKSIYFCLQTRDSIFLSIHRIQSPRSRATTNAMLGTFAKIALRLLSGQMKSTFCKMP